MNQTIEREPLRTEMRPQESRDAAAIRAAQIMENVPDFDGVTDEFWIDPAIIPDGWDYNWKTKTVWEKENPSYDVALARTGWQAVPLDRDERHRALMPAGWTGGNTILRKGMILMERPMEITRRVMDMDKLKARNQVKMKEDQLNSAPPGTFDRDNKGTPLSKVRKTYEPMPIPS